MATQWAPGSLHSKGKIRVFLLQEVLFACAMFMQWVGLSVDITKQSSTRKSVRLWCDKIIRHFSFWEGRVLLTSIVIEKDHLGDWSPEKDCC